VPFIPGPQESVEKLALTRTSDQAISALKVVRLTSSTNVDIADSTLTFADAIVAGIALDTAPAAGVEIQVQTYGVLEDAFFTFPLNDLLFLSSNGTITNTAPSLGGGDTHRVAIGKSLGVGAIFIDIEEPIIL